MTVIRLVGAKGVPWLVFPSSSSLLSLSFLSDRVSLTRGAPLLSFPPPLLSSLFPSSSSLLSLLSRRGVALDGKHAASVTHAAHPLTYNHTQ
jgi:hypothetical protein